MSDGSLPTLAAVEQRAAAARVEAVSASRPLYTWLVTVALTSKGALGLR